MCANTAAAATAAITNSVITTKDIYSYYYIIITTTTTTTTTAVITTINTCVDAIDVATAHIILYIFFKVFSHNLSSKKRLKRDFYIFIVIGVNLPL